ncbi:hypothetical protein HDV00_001344 [Rhizophlyctis rosea]|nr:hypothetical protein HDV00_001344 [Rhizophlyctis rosea]
MESFMKVLNDAQLFQEFKNFTAMGGPNSSEEIAGIVAGERGVTPTTTPLPPIKPAIHRSADTIASVARAFAELPVPENVKPHYLAFFETYIRPGAPFEVNIPSNVREAITACIEKDVFTIGMYDKAKEEVITNMFFNTFPTYVRHLESKGRHLSTRPPTAAGAHALDEGEISERMEAGAGAGGSHEE